MEAFVHPPETEKRESYFPPAWVTSGPPSSFIFLGGPLAIFSSAICETRRGEFLESPWKRIGETNRPRRSGNAARRRPPIRFQVRVPRPLRFHPPTPPPLPPQFPRRLLGGSSVPWTDDVAPQSPCGAGS